MEYALPAKSELRLNCAMPIRDAAGIIPTEHSSSILANGWFLASSARHTAARYGVNGSEPMARSPNPRVADPVFAATQETTAGDLTRRRTGNLSTNIRICITVPDIVRTVRIRPSADQLGSDDVVSGHAADANIWRKWVSVVFPLERMHRKPSPDVKYSQCID